MGTCDGDASAVEVCAEQVSQILSLLFSSLDCFGCRLTDINVPRCCTSTNSIFLLNLCDLHVPKTNVNSIVGFYKENSMQS